MELHVYSLMIIIFYPAHMTELSSYGIFRYKFLLFKTITSFKLILMKLKQQKLKPSFFLLKLFSLRSIQIFVKLIFKFLSKKRYKEAFFLFFNFIFKNLFIKINITIHILDLLNFYLKNPFLITKYKIYLKYRIN